MWKKIGLAGLLLSQTSFCSDYIPPSNQCNLKMFSGSCSKDLANEVAGILGVQLGRARISKFSDGESDIRILEDVSGADVYLISSIGHPVNDSLIELLLFTSALKRANCSKVILIIPYLAYNRQDTPKPGNLCIPAEDIPKLIEASEADMVIGVDFHGEHVEGLFKIPVHEILPYTIAVDYLRRKALLHPVIMSTDVRAVSRAYEFFKLMKLAGISCDFALLPNPGGSLSYIGEESAYIGDKLTGRDVIIIDDMIISGKSLFRVLDQIRKKDAEKIYFFATHPVLADGTVRKINNSSLTELICTNTLPISEPSSKIVQLSLAKLIAGKIIDVYQSR